jgi:hypothetical protein
MKSGKRTKAQIFVSCGQQPHEMEIVDKIEARLKDMDFDVWVTRRTCSVNGVKEHIFTALQNSEYFLFIDFKREKLKSSFSCCPAYRGSLFTNQELSIASYLGMEALGFQEEGIKELDGMMGTILLNCDKFSDKAELPDLIERKIKENKWRNDWKAQLCMDRADPEDALDVKNDPPAIFHINLRNQDWRKPALDCRAYIDAVYDLNKDRKIDFRTFELKWAGTTVPNVTIMPGGFRRFDAFTLCKYYPARLCWRTPFSFADTPKVWPLIWGEGKYLISYVVTSFNFLPVRTTFQLELKEDYFQTVLTVVESEYLGPAESTPLVETE